MKAPKYFIGITGLCLLLFFPVLALAGILKWVELPQIHQDPYIYSIDYNSLQQKNDGWAYFLLKEVPKPGSQFQKQASAIREPKAAFYIEYAAVNRDQNLVKPIEIRAYSETSKVLKYYKFPENATENMDANPLYRMISDFAYLYFIVIQHPKAKENANQYAYALQGYVYSGVLQRQLQKHWEPKTSDDEVSVHFLINKTGKVVDPRITKSANSETLDKLALKTIEQAAPFPSFPSNWQQETITVELIFKKKIVKTTIRGL